ncbi:Uncharacterized protein APZ42_019510 [Daphnia magna]|uniref:Uncharacterized protein n=1 Tax=Daphnia magna TaxID=35525 RepID=A0A164Y7Q8_9CRUS|nr:Uncharacterized protein APZ42_019510 [Daphnia magna]
MDFIRIRSDGIVNFCLQNFLFFFICLVLLLGDVCVAKAERLAAFVFARSAKMHFCNDPSIRRNLRLWPADN